MRNKCIIFFCLAATFMLGSSVYALPEESIDEENVISPYYTYISATTVSLSIENNGLSYSGGTLKIFQDYDTSITLTLQRKKSENSSWSDVQSWSKSFTGMGSHGFESKYYVTSGYIYRVVNTTKVIQNGNVIEAINSYSYETKH